MVVYKSTTSLTNLSEFFMFSSVAYLDKGLSHLDMPQTFFFPKICRVL